MKIAEAKQIIHDATQWHLDNNSEVKIISNYGRSELWKGGILDVKEVIDLEKDREVNVDFKVIFTHNSRNFPKIQEVIEYLESTSEDSWCVDVVKTDSGGNCLLGHLFDFGGNILTDMFENCFATTYMFYPVNDGENPNYKQPTPKQRCIAYIKDLVSGVAKTTQQIMEEEYEEYLKNNPQK